jgi:hypothetical protein
MIVTVLVHAIASFQRTFVCLIERILAAQRVLFKSLSFLILTIAVPFCSLVVVAQQTSVVSIELNTAYDDSSASLESIARLISALPPRKEILNSGESASAFILRMYRVSSYDSTSSSYLPKTYALLLKAILELNHVLAPEDLKTGQILVPNIPRKALAYPGPHNTYNKVPGVSTSQSEYGAKGAYVGPIQESNFGRPATQTQILEVPLPPEQARKILQDRKILDSSSVLNFPMTVSLKATTARLLAEQSQIDHSVLNQSDRDKIHKLIVNNSKRDARVFILDTGWPTPDIYSDSRAQLKSLISFLWQNSLSLETPRLLPDAPFHEPSNIHCDVIRRATREFEQLDSGHRVHSIYIPLTREQDSGPILTLLLETSFLLEFKKQHPESPLPTDIVRNSERNAKRIVREVLVDKWVGDSVTTDKAIIDATLRVGSALADTTKTAFVINESWTVPQEQYFVYYPPPRGIVVAATGNTGQNISTAGIDFAERSSTSIDTLAVMNFQLPDGPICCSSKIDERDIGSTLAVGFDGEVMGKDCAASLCGTSFAAPRVAWTIAAGEVIRSSEFESARWNIELRNRIFSARKNSQTGIVNTWFDPVLYLSLIH